MKLMFPNGEHSPVLLQPGMNRIGSKLESQVTLGLPGVLPLHCEIHVAGAGVNLQVPAGVASVRVNGRPVTGLMALRQGDLLEIGPVLARMANGNLARNPIDSSDGDLGATRVRMAIPKYLLRGLSGPVFGRVFPLSSPAVIGRADECDIAVAVDEISRRHVRLKPTPTGLLVEDLDSANGTYINGKRVQTGTLHPGDELRLDTLRFLLEMPGSEPAAPMPNLPPVAAGAVSSPRSSKAWIWLSLACLVVVGMVLFALR